MSQEQPGFYEIIYTMRSLRRFKPDPIPDEVLFQAFDVAIRAPSGQNKQDWRWIVITDQAVKERMQGWAQAAWERYQPDFAQNPEKLDELPRTRRLSLKSVEHLSHHLAEAPVLVLVLGLKGAHSTPGGSTFPAVQNFLLALRAQGVGGSVFNLGLGDREEVARMLEIPENNEIKCLLPIGYPSDRHGPVRRKPVKQVVFKEKFGQPWEFAEQQPDEGWGERWIGED